MKISFKNWLHEQANLKDIEAAVRAIVGAEASGIKSSSDNNTKSIVKTVNTVGSKTQEAIKKSAEKTTEILTGSNKPPVGKPAELGDKMAQKIADMVIANQKAQENPRRPNTSVPPNSKPTAPTNISAGMKK